MDKNKLLKILDNFNGKKIMVLGDIIADEYIFGKTTRVSREAPVLILKYDSQEIFLGGAANSINNINALSGKVFPVGLVGQDAIGEKLLKIMKEKNIDTGSIIVEPSIFTITKTRIMAGGYHTARQQVIRIDKEQESLINKSTEDRIINQLQEKLPEMDALLVSDYGEGLITEKLRSAVLNLVKKYQKIIVVDSRFNIMKYIGATLITPNETEAAPAVGMRLEKDTSLKTIGLKLLEKTKAKGVLITQGRNGMTLFESKNKITHIDIIGSDEAVDVTGAGDTVASCSTLTLASGANLFEAAQLANYAAGIVVMKRGTAVVTIEEIKQKMENE